MKSIHLGLSLALALAVVAAGFAPTDAHARRLGGGSSAGMQRSIPSRAPTSTPATPTQAAPATAGTAGTAGAPAVAPRRSWMGPIAGLAAGLGIAALMSHFGMGEGLGNIVMLALLAFVAFAIIRALMNRFAGSSGVPSMATPNNYSFDGATPRPLNYANPVGNPGWGSPTLALAPGAAVALLPAGFDTAGFERIAKMIFIRMQAANDVADLNDLRSFTTPEMFASVKLDLQDRSSAAQTTDVVHVDAQVLEVATEADRQLVSVRFHGLIREERDGAAEPFEEIWHLARPVDASHEWAIAGIQQAQ
jgi:predicted lipid-binding transport protein (Tim44 family)